MEFGTQRILVTGGLGWLGRGLVHALTDGLPDVAALRSPPSDVAVRVLDAAPVGGTLGGRVEVVTGDVRDAGDCTRFCAGAKDAILFHTAGIIHPARVRDFYDVNVAGTRNVLAAAAAAGVRRAVVMSSNSPCGCNPHPDHRFDETSPYRPRTPYNASKAAADHFVRAYHETFGLPVTISNCSNNYGPYQFPEKVIPLFATHALDDEPLPLYASTTHRREWLHVIDHCRAIELVLEKGEVGETYNVGSGVEATIEQIADLVLDALGKPASLKTIVPDRPGHDRRYLLDSAKLRRELGWAPTVDFDDGIRDTVTWYASNRAWWEPLRDRAPVVESAWSGATSDAADVEGTDRADSR